VGDSAWAGDPLFGCLIKCFIFILNLYIFLKMLKYQLMSNGLKIPHLCH
jgi:hypothetical protein